MTWCCCWSQQQRLLVLVEWVVTKGEWWEGQCGFPRRTIQQRSAFHFYDLSLLNWNAIPHDLCDFEMRPRRGGDQSGCFSRSSHYIRNHSKNYYYFFFCCVLAAVARARGDKWLRKAAKLENSTEADVHALFKLFSKFISALKRLLTRWRRVHSLAGLLVFFLHRW